MEPCPICGRELSGAFIQEHHLIPVTFKGKETIRLHKVCHQKIHSIFAERELKNYYNTPEKLLESVELQKFVKWIANKDIDFYDKNDETKVRKSKRWK